mmetsp:Transcript_87118/g.186812  ORF Transcript_87118/g.186812 Transcript_87118/m.186812 type:complete len:82 (+) Transcript_87118:323-568(+)
MQWCPTIKARMRDIWVCSGFEQEPDQAGVLEITGSVQWRVEVYIRLVDIGALCQQSPYFSNVSPLRGFVQGWKSRDRFRRR